MFTSDISFIIEFLWLRNKFSLPRYKSMLKSSQSGGGHPQPFFSLGTRILQANKEENDFAMVKYFAENEHRLV